jgi:hypothetical protein
MVPRAMPVLLPIALFEDACTDPVKDRSDRCAAAPALVECPRLISISPLRWKVPYVMYSACKYQTLFLSKLKRPIFVPMRVPFLFGCRFVRREVHFTAMCAHRSDSQRYHWVELKKPLTISTAVDVKRYYNILNVMIVSSSRLCIGPDPPHVHCHCLCVVVPL